MCWVTCESSLALGLHCCVFWALSTMDEMSQRPVGSWVRSTKLYGFSTPKRQLPRCTETLSLSAKAPCTEYRSMHIAAVELKSMFLLGFLQLLLCVSKTSQLACQALLHQLLRLTTNLQCSKISNMLSTKGLQRPPQSSNASQHRAVYTSDAARS